MSDILTIYDTFAGLSITAAGVTFDTSRTYDLDELHDWVEAADLPLRLLSISTGGDVHTGQFIALGTAAKIVWRVTDLMLWAPAPSDRGIRDHVQALYEYAGAYIDALRNIRGPAAAGADQAHIVGFSMRRGVIRYPEGGDGLYYGVVCEVDVEEFLG